MHAGSGEALVSYLSQPGARPDVCRVDGEGEHLAAYDLSVGRALAAAVRDQPVDPAIYQPCLASLLRTLGAGHATSLYNALLGAYRDMLVDRRLDTDVALLARLTMVQHLFLHRPPDTGPSAGLVKPMLAELEGALARGKLRPTAARFGRELLDTLALERGVWQGRGVDEAMMDALADAGNDLTLSRFAARLPSEDLRAAARVRRVRIHAARSPFREVREASDELLAKVSAFGFHPVSLAAHPVVRVRVEPASPQVLRVRQAGDGTAVLLASCGDHAPGLLGATPLSGLVRVTLRGISREVTVCDPGADLDPSPCIALGDVSLADPLARLDARGAVVFREHLALEEVEALAERTRVEVPVQIGAHAPVQLGWRVRFERPAALELEGFSSGEDGPDVRADVHWPLDGGRVRFEVHAEARTYVAFLEQADVPYHRVVSRGGAGASGSTGLSGSAGASALSACGRGGDGIAGQPGGDGEPGGNGGNIVVHVACADAAACTRARRALTPVFVSEGGAGGQGGAGGSGGRGGSGGSGRTSSSLSESCMRGSDGHTGSDGARGWSGSSGAAGRVTFELQQAPAPGPVSAASPP